MKTPHIATLDAGQFGRPGLGAAYLVRGERTGLIESGTAAAGEHLADQLSSLLGARRLDYIFLTHIHLDHAGGAGALAARYPDAAVVVHARGLPHLIDPSRLIEGVQRASPSLFPLYGRPTLIPEDQLVGVVGGESFDLGDGIQIDVVASPGHAPHHVCFYEPRSRTLFTGDAVGNWGIPVHVPLTVPPRFTLETGLETLETLRQLHPRSLAYTHFGITKNAVGQIDGYARTLTAWFDRLRSLSKDRSARDVVSTLLSAPPYAGLTEIERQMVEMCVRGGLLSLEAGTA